ncbi:MAG: hypothetical protein D6761_04915 [Candidatus Dadabacteria bacterium]|nr:MAG: hypothetical protein D6761_04915 [Candidatus Dadabacteria bacterium]
MSRATPWLVAALAAWVLVAAEGVFAARIPGDVLSLLMLPALYLRDRRARLTALAALLLIEVLLDRTLVLAALSLLVTVEMIVSLMHDDFNLVSPLFAALSLPVIELLRHFWIAIFAANYDIAAPPALSIPRLVMLAAGGLLMHLAVTAWMRGRVPESSRRWPA